MARATRASGERNPNAILVRSRSFVALLLHPWVATSRSGSSPTGPWVSRYAGRSGVAAIPRQVAWLLHADAPEHAVAGSAVRRARTAAFTSSMDGWATARSTSRVAHGHLGDQRVARGHWATSGGRRGRGRATDARPTPAWSPGPDVQRGSAQQERPPSRWADRALTHPRRPLPVWPSDRPGRWPCPRGQSGGQGPRAAPSQNRAAYPGALAGAGDGVESGAAQRRSRRARGFRHRGKHVLHVFRDAVLGAAFQQIRSPTTGTTRLQPQNSSAEPHHAHAHVHVYVGTDLCPSHGSPYRQHVPP
jgi:hypothetical protein